MKNLLVLLSAIITMLSYGALALDKISSTLELLIDDIELHYHIEFCGTFTALNKNLDIAELLVLDRFTTEPFEMAIIDRNKIQFLNQWRSENCAPYETYFELYQEENSSLQTLYPNWRHRWR